MNRWSVDETKLLIENYQIKDIDFCCDLLNRSQSQIRNKAFKLGIKSEKDISGDKNPNWKGGRIEKTCTVCGKEYIVRNSSKSNFCSLRCYGISQRGSKRCYSINKEGYKILKNNLKYTKNTCLVCGNEYDIRICHSNRSKTCSLLCSRKYRSIISSGENNPSWSGGVSRMPYPYNWAKISKSIIERDGNICMNPNCKVIDKRMTVHHIDYDKMNCNPINLITVCETCNSVANFGRQQWYDYYMDVQEKRGIASIDYSVPEAKQIKDQESRKGENHPMSKLTYQDVYEIRSYLSIFKSRGTKSAIARLFGVTDSLIYNIVNRNIWK